MTEVLGWSAQEFAETLATSVASVNSALQRARATLATRDLGEPEPLSDAQTKLVARYVDAFERYDVAALTNLLCEDATLSMPPFTLWLRGHASISAWLRRTSQVHGRFFFRGTDDSGRRSESMLLN